MYPPKDSFFLNSSGSPLIVITAPKFALASANFKALTIASAPVEAEIVV